MPPRRSHAPVHRLGWAHQRGIGCTEVPVNAFIELRTRELVISSVEDFKVLPLPLRVTTDQVGAREPGEIAADPAARPLERFGGTCGSLPYQRTQRIGWQGAARTWLNQPSFDSPTKKAPRGAFSVLQLAERGSSKRSVKAMLCGRCQAHTPHLPPQDRSH